jgi:hypothetical protein
MPANHKYPAWSDAEDEKLALLWKNHELRDLAKRLDRSEDALAKRARFLGLGLPFHKTPHRRPWSSIESGKLAFLWGQRDLVDIAAVLKRTPMAITRRASYLQLGPPHGGGKTMNELARTSGYSLSRLQFAVEALGLRIGRRRRASITQSKFVHSFCVSEDQETAICEWLKNQPDGKPLLKPTGRKTAGGVWGIGLKPACCTECQTKNRPHYARGKCRLCYHRRFKKKRETKEMPMEEYHDDATRP